MACGRVFRGGLRGAGRFQAFLDELIVRRELARNLVWHNPHYDSLRVLESPAGGGHWALGTLQDHSMDRRQQLYSFAQLEAGQTGDRYWNAAQVRRRRGALRQSGRGRRRARL